MPDAERRLLGRIAVVTGAAGGFGRAISERLVREGASVALWDRDREGAEAQAAAIDPTGGATFVAAVDVADSAAVDAAAAATRAALGVADLLVNNAGISEAAAPWEVTDADWDRHMGINASGTFFCIRAHLGGMRERRYGKIVNVASLSAQQGRPTTSPAYPASKGAVLGLTVSLGAPPRRVRHLRQRHQPGVHQDRDPRPVHPAQLAPLTAGIPLNRAGVDERAGCPRTSPARPTSCCRRTPTSSPASS